MRRRDILKIGGASIMGGAIGASASSGKGITDENKRFITDNFPVVVLSESLSKKISIIENETDVHLRNASTVDGIIRLRKEKEDLGGVGISTQIFHVPRGQRLPDEINNKKAHNMTAQEIKLLLSGNNKNNKSIDFNSYTKTNLNFDVKDEHYINLRNKSLPSEAEFILGVKLREIKASESVSDY